jgi:hypothetical protein
VVLGHVNYCWLGQHGNLGSCGTRDAICCVVEAPDHIVIMMALSLAVRVGSRGQVWTSLLVTMRRIIFFLVFSFCFFLKVGGNCLHLQHAECACQSWFNTDKLAMCAYVRSHLLTFTLLAVLATVNRPVCPGAGFKQADCARTIARQKYVWPRFRPRSTHRVGWSQCVLARAWVPQRALSGQPRSFSRRSLRVHPLIQRIHVLQTLALTLK